LQTHVRNVEPERANNARKTPETNANADVRRKKTPSVMQCRVSQEEKKTALNGKSLVDVVKQKDSRSLLKPRTEKQRTAS
jgi:hypothetical protein